MGRPDLVVCINGIAFLIKEDAYNSDEQAIEIAMLKHRKRINDLKCCVEFPEDIDSNIQEIKVYDLAV